MIFKRDIILLFFFSLCINIYGQGFGSKYKALKFKNISLKEGLSQSSVLSILQDRKGFLWFGTRDGLNKYDGNEFITFRHNSKDSTSLSHSFIRSLYQDKNGNLWVGTIDGINKYEPHTNSFRRYSLKNSREGNTSIDIWSIVGQDDGFLWLGTNEGLKKMNIKKAIFEDIRYNDFNEELFNTSVRTLLITNKNNLWVKTTNKIGVYNLDTHKVKYYSYPDNIPTELNKNNVSVLYEDKKGNIWFGFENGLALLNKELDSFEFFKIKSEKGDSIKDHVRSICEDYLGNLWVGTYKGLYVVNKNHTNISHFVHDQNNPNSLSQNSIYKIYEDNKGDMWIGTYAGGISYHDRSYDNFKHFSSGTNNTKLNYKVVSSILEDSEDNLWIGTEGGGINFYNKSSGTYKYYTNNSDDVNSLSTNNVKAMIQDADGNFWVGTHDGGLNFFNPKIEPVKFLKYNNIPNNNNSISDNRVISLLEDYKGNIWIGTSGGGINVLNKDRNKIARIEDKLDLAGKLIYTITKTSNRDYILIGGEKGLVKVNIISKELYPINYLNKYQKNKSAVLCVFEDKKKNLWIGTEGDGIFYYNQTNKVSIKYDTSNGLPNNVVYGILPDDNDNIWVSTNSGLSKINLESNRIKNYRESDGLQGNEFNYGAFLKNKKGELLFGGTNGFNIFNPNDIVENSFIPPIAITSFKVNNKPYLNITDSIQEIELKYNQNVINFDFVALSYSQPDKNQYAYKLEGFDKDWIYIGNRKSATYTNLDKGDYIFRVKASNNDGLWNEKGVELKIEIFPAPWRTWWAYLVYCFFIITIILTIRKYSLIRIKERNELKNERLEKERIEEVNKLKLQLFTNISHDFRTPLTLIIGPLERLLKEKSENNFIRKQHEIMYRNASTLMELINQLLDFRKNESGKLKLYASKSNIVPFVKNIKLAFDELARIKNIKYSFTSTFDDIDVWFDKTQLKKIIFNLLSNAFKFTPNGGNIALHIEIFEELRNTKPFKYVKLEVRDNGKGISKSNRKFIFDRFYQLGERSGTGIGLALTKNLVELHKGIIKVKSDENRGTCFKVFLPLGKGHLKEDQMFEGDKASNNSDFYDLEDSVLLDNKSIPLELENQKGNNVTVNKELSSILLVEDNVEVRAFIKSIFLDNYNVFEASNGEVAIEIAKTYSIDLIISDIMMPIMDGIELCNEIKTNIKTSHIPIILLTAKTSQESQKSGYQIGADAYITKPFDSEILEVRVSYLLKSRKNLIDKFKKDVILQPKELTVTSADELFLKKAIDIVEGNLTNSEFTIQDFISEMGTSRSVLYRKLKALTDQSISEFIKTIKLKRAAQLLEQTQMTISEVAFDLGYSDLKHFRKSFQKLFNELPSQYRKSN